MWLVKQNRKLNRKAYLINKQKKAGWENRSRFKKKKLFQHPFGTNVFANAPLTN